MKKIETEGNFSGIIKECYPVEHRFKPGNLEIKIVVTPEGGEYDDANLYLDMTTEYIKNSNPPARQIDKAIETLKFLGMPDNDLSKLDMLVGLPASFYTKFNAKGYLGFFISKFSETKVDAKEATARMMAMLGGGGTAATATKNLFAAEETDDIPF